MKRIIWAPFAKKSLLQSVDFLSEIWDDEIIDEFLNQLDYRIAQIQRNPELAPALIESEFRQLIIHKSVSLFYRNYPEYLKLLLVWDHRQDPAQLLEILSDANKY